MDEVVQSLKSSSKNYSELGSCPSLNSGRRPLLTRTIGGGGGGGGSNSRNSSLKGRSRYGSSTPPPRDGVQTDERVFVNFNGTSSCRESTKEELVQTSKGPILVARHGDPKKPVLITYHDIGLNYLSNFQAFFTSGAMMNVLETFCIYHITAPGQEAGAKDLPEGYVYPTMDELADQVEYVIHYFGISHCIGFGVGFGANVLVRLAHRRPTMVDGLILVNCSSQSAGWLEWVYHKVNIKSLKKVQQQQQQDPQQPQSQVPSSIQPVPSNSDLSQQTADQGAPSELNNDPNNGGDSSMGQLGSNRLGLPESVVDYLMWYHLGRPDADGRPLEAVSIASIYKQHFSSTSDVVSPRNLALLLQTYMARNDLGLAREIASNGKPLLGSTRTLKMPVLNMTGDQSPHVDATVVFNGRLQPNRCTWMKFQDAAMILEEQPAKVAEALKLFLQGLGHTLSKRRASGQATTTANSKSTSSVQASSQPEGQEATVCQTDILVEGLEDLKVAAAAN